MKSDHLNIRGEKASPLQSWIQFIFLPRKRSHLLTKKMQNTDDSSVPYSGFFNRLPGIQFIPDSYFLSSSSSPSSPRGLCHHKFSGERRKKKVDFVPSAKKRSIEYGGFYLPPPSLDSSIFVDPPPPPSLLIRRGANTVFPFSFLPLFYLPLLPL